MATWRDVAIDNLRAAGDLKAHWTRSSASRSYYAAFSLVTEALQRAGAPFGPGRDSPRHRDVPDLIREHLFRVSDTRRRDVQKIIRRLYQRRLDADYRPGRTVDRRIAMDSLRDALTIAHTFGVKL